MTDALIRATRNLPASLIRSTRHRYYDLHRLQITGYIPPEIIDAIIDCLRGDKDTLLACSFVCRVFRPRTRVHLFHTLELKFNGTLNVDLDDLSFKRSSGT